MGVAELLERDRFAAALGACLIMAEAERVVVEMTVGPRHLDEHGGVSGGALFSLADCAMSLISNAEATEVAVATHFVRHGSARPGDVVTAEARPELPSRDRAHTWLVLLSVDESVVATFTGTTLRLPG